MSELKKKGPEKFPAAMWLARFIGASLIVFAILKFSESWIFDLSKGEATEPPHFESPDDVEVDPVVALRRRERAYFHRHREPAVLNRRCDACRIIAHNFDVAFEEAELQLLGIKNEVRVYVEEIRNDIDDELSKEEVHDIVTKVCQVKTFQKVEPVIIHGDKRLASPGIETEYHLENRFFVDLHKDKVYHDLQEDEVDAIDDEDHGTLWPHRLKDQCLHFTENLNGKEIYEMWLRTSAGSTKNFDEFLCYGEGLFASCMINNKPESWINNPLDGANDQEEDEELKKVVIRTKMPSSQNTKKK